MSTHFADPQMQALERKVIGEFGELAQLAPVSVDEYFGKLVESVISQQLSTKVADVIEARARVAVGGSWQPEHVLVNPPERLREAGLSNAKVHYIRNIAQAFSDGSVVAETLPNLSDEEVIEHLIQIKGVGRWTAEMFLIFTLARPDVFSAGDYGLRKAISITYGLALTEKPAKVIELSKAWRPERSLASRILWKSLELPTKE